MNVRIFSAFMFSCAAGAHSMAQGVLPAIYTLTMTFTICVVVVMKSWNIKWAMHVASAGEKENCLQIGVRKSQGKNT
jgi:hypothetical protein